ncbi:MAG: trimethylamine methyltransferase family protein [Chloroflexi bacterium]|nr:trimethylamine methyltransferase family protein [Chloroflexota bacterium]
MDGESPKEQIVIVNRHPRVELFSAEDVERVHQASLRILEETGYAIHSEEALDILEATPGTRVDRDQERVWFDPKLVERSIAQCPPSCTFHARNPKHNRTIGGDHITVTPVGGCPFTHDLERGRRIGSLADVVELDKLVYQLPETDGAGTGMVAMQNVPVPLRPAVTSLVTALLSDKVSGVSGLAPRAGDLDRDPIAEFKESVGAIFGSDWDYVARPLTHGFVNTISPLMLDDRMAGTLINSAKCGQPCLISPLVMGGISGPMTFAGVMAQSNAEFLGGLVLAQAVRPGVPVIYGCLSTICDMKIGAPAYGSVELALATCLTAQTARRYGIPSRGGGGLSDSKLPDVQAGYEHMILMLVTVLSGINMFTHGAGMFESFLCSSYELLMLDQDAIGMVKRLVQGPAIDDEELAVDVIHAVGPQGMFLTTDHTYRHFKRAYFEPKLMDRQVYAEWAKRGAKRADQRATEAWKQLLTQYRGPEIPLDPHVVRLYEERIRRTESLMEQPEDWPRHLVGLAPASRVG